ncbi:MAG: hypothetical protein Q8Q03_01365 [bacterium]|nr:hypothetical protein [bacterium]
MTKLSFKQAIPALLLASLIVSVLFSFSFNMAEAGGRMHGECPFSAMGQSICSQDAVAAAIHHISAYNSFSNIPIRSILIILAFSLLVSIIIYTLPLLEHPAFAYSTHNFQPDSNKRKINRWLSLLENSPSSF